MSESVSKQSMQAAFDKATAALLNQGSRCSTRNSCYYRHPTIVGMKCAIGHLLSDNQIREFHILEGMTPSQFPNELLASILPGVEKIDAQEFLDKMQSAHDGMTSDDFRRSFTSRANDVALEFGLTPINAL